MLTRFRGHLVCNVLPLSFNLRKIPQNIFFYVLISKLTTYLKDQFKAVERKINVIKWWRQLLVQDNTNTDSQIF